MQYRVSEVEPDKPVTLTLPAVDMLTVGTALLQAAREIIDRCEQPQGCGFCIPLGMELQRIGLTIVNEVAHAGTFIPPNHTAN